MDPVSLTQGVMAAKHAQTMMAIAAAMAKQKHASDQSVVNMLAAAADAGKQAVAQVAGSAGLVDIEA